MNSLLHNVLIVAKGILMDVSVAYPEYTGVWRDFERLTLVANTRGLGLFTLDLPHLDSLLTDGLENGRLVPKGALTQCVSKKIKVPRLFAGLWLRVFSKDSCLLSEVDVNAIFFLRQLCCLGKKLDLACSAQRTHKSVGEFHAIERSIQRPTLKWDEDRLDPDSRLRNVHFRDILDGDLPLFRAIGEKSDPETELLLRKCQIISDIFCRRIGTFEAVSFSNEKSAAGKPTGFRHGPGAVAERVGKFDKYEFTSWSDKLQEWFPFEDCAITARSTKVRPKNYEYPSRLIAVPKTAKGPRLIAAEPTEHQWCQQLMRSFLVERLVRMFGEDFICFHKQSLSQDAVLAASLDKSLATIDLSSASDRLSCFVVERLFRKSPLLLHSMHACRTRYIKDSISSVPEFVKLNKFASQGTALTFPVQTIAFLVMALAGCIEGVPTWSKINALRKQVRVYGDDIIIPRTGYASTIRVLEALGLKPNMEKSFHKGDFLESCGMDAYKGYDVTPCKPRTLVDDGPTSRIALVDTCNNFFKKGLWHAAKAVESTLPRKLLSSLPKVDRDSGATSLRTFSKGSQLPDVKSRWNEVLQRMEYWTWTFRTKTQRRQADGESSLLQYFTEAPLSDWSNPISYMSGFDDRPISRDRYGWEPLYL